MKFKERIWWIASIILLIGILSQTVIKSNSFKKQVNAVRSENKEYRNKYNELVSEKQAFVGKAKQMKAEIEYWKSQGDTLRSKVTNQTQQITYLKKKLEIAGSGNVKPLPPDTVIVIAKTAIDTPIIAIDTSDQWHSFKFAGNKYKYAYQLSIIDNTEIETKDLGRKGTLVSVINRNPYIVSSEAKSVVISPEKPSVLKKAIWIGIGLGAGWMIFR